jgi:hypothetical protein
VKEKLIAVVTKEDASWHKKKPDISKSDIINKKSCYTEATKNYEL